MLVVGLTGGIASGKTTVSDLFASHGVSVVDSDIISREMLNAGQEGYQLVVNHLGDRILDDNLAINRQALREAVFNDPNLKEWLEQKLHPLIYQACEQALSTTAPDHYALLVVPLMFETDFHQLADRICVIDCPQKLQQQRLIVRDRIAAELADKMISSQMNNASRLARADDVIHNRGDPEALSSQVASLHQQYLKQARSQSQ